MCFGGAAFAVARAEVQGAHPKLAIFICVGHELMTYAHFMVEFFGGNSYLPQKTIHNHEDFAKYCSALAPVWMINSVRKDGLYNPVAVIKIPKVDNIADPFGRPCNIACKVDVASGYIKTMVLCSGPDLDFLEDHLSIPGLMGMKLPL